MASCSAFIAVADRGGAFTSTSPDDHAVGAVRQYWVSPSTATPKSTPRGEIRPAGCEPPRRFLRAAPSMHRMGSWPYMREAKSRTGSFSRRTRISSGLTGNWCTTMSVSTKFRSKVVAPGIPAHSADPRIQMSAAIAFRQPVPIPVEFLRPDQEIVLANPFRRTSPPTARARPSESLTATGNRRIRPPL